MKRFRVTQQEIVFVVFAALFAVFAAFLPGFFTADNMVNRQSTAVSFTPNMNGVAPTGTNPISN